MKKLGLLVMFVAVGTMLSGCVSTGPTQSAVSAGEAEKIAEEITQLSNEWSQVLITKDFDHLRRIWADDFSFTANDGNVDNREDGFAFFEGNTDTFTSVRLPAFKVRVYGKNFAVSNGDHHEVGKDKEGKPFSRKFRFTNVWVRKNGKWKVVAGHDSELDLATDPTQSAVSAEEAEKIAEEITQLTKQWSIVHTTKDWDFLKRIWADDFSYIGADGTVRDKEAELAYMEEDTETLTSASCVAFNLRVYGKNFAIGNGDHHEAGKDKEGKPFSRKFRFTNVWVRKQNVYGERKWQVVAGHASLLD
jgi:ketosteroid isomerase-like protein